jgi:Flp pilus assembly protein TadD
MRISWIERVLAAGFILLVLNSAYLWARAEPTIAYYLNVALHPLLGFALGALAAWRFRAVWRATPLRTLTTVTLVAAAVLGTAVLVVGATRPYYSVVQTHVVSAIAGAALLSIELWRSARARRSTTKLVVASIAVVFVAVLAAALTRATHDVNRGREYRILNPDVVPATMDQEGRGPGSAFFPSSAVTKGGELVPSNFFLTSAACGRCHADIYEQWNSSMHHFASFNNQWYRKSIEYMQEIVGTRPSKWCAGCHDHAMLFSGRFDQPAKHQIDTAEAQAGLGCISCHAITRVHGTMGQGGFEIEYSALHDLAASPNRLLRTAHDKLLDLAPRPHREAFIKPFHREQGSEFCSSCHKVHLDEPVNAYRWLRGFNDYDNWQASGVSGEGARSFYYPPQSQTCTDCHMPRVPSNDPAARDGTVRSHRFAAANTAVPFVNGDTTQLNAVHDFLRDGQVTIDVFGIVRTAAPAGSGATTAAGGDVQEATTFGVGEESFNFGGRPAVLPPAAGVLGPLGVVPVAVRRGESVRLEVVVRTRKVGHFFPGGTVDAFDVWVEVDARDSNGRILLHSGSLDPSGAVEPGAHRYRSLLLDEHGNPINKRNAWAARSVAYVRLIPPGAADTIHYRLDIPETAGDTISITARLKYRKFAWWNTQWAYAGVRDPRQPSFALAPGHDDGAWVFTGDTSGVSGRLKAIPDPPITEMAVSQAVLPVLSATAAAPESQPGITSGSRERWNDYGIGLLLQGDIRGAEAAFLRVTQIDPDYADGWVNIGRARIQEGNMAGAEQILRRALSVDPALAKTQFFLGTVLRALGRYDEALAHLRRAASQYPRDRVVLNQIGRVLFLKREFREAVTEFRKVLAIDPEDLQAHYNLMLCYQGLGDAAGAARERALYERFKADEASQAITGNYRRLNVHDNNERQQIHEHRTVSAR